MMKLAIFREYQDGENKKRKILVEMEQEEILQYLIHNLKSAQEGALRYTFQEMMKHFKEKSIKIP